MDARLDSIRTLLFVPGDDARKLDRALASEADAVVVDLEDAVTESRKQVARELAAEALARAPGRPLRLVRVNAAGTPYLADDLACLGSLEVDGLVLPKASPEALDALSLADMPVIAIVETAVGVRLAWEIATHPLVVALMLGAVDLSVELRLEARSDGLELQYVRSKLVIDSAAAGVRAPFDAVHLAVDDTDGLRASAELARSLGLGGKACIHPAQLAVVNDVFTADQARIDWARRVVEAASSTERGAIAVDGALVDRAVVSIAERIIRESEHHEN